MTPALACDCINVACDYIEVAIVFSILLAFQSISFFIGKPQLPNHSVNVDFLALMG
jgi:hypothetical protein